MEARQKEAQEAEAKKREAERIEVEQRKAQDRRDAGNKEDFGLFFAWVWEMNGHTQALHVCHICLH